VLLPRKRDARTYWRTEDENGSTRTSNFWPCE
jgi:hypothetical protein